MTVIAPTPITYPIVETFHSIQGEGAWMGVSAFFIRLAGCDVHCSWCDQKESWPIKPYPQRSVEELAELAKQTNPAIVVITGGEPLIHNLDPLTDELRSLGLRVHLETSGTHPFSGSFDWVTFSPKMFGLPNESIYNQVNELKVVIASELDLYWGYQEAKKVPLDAIKYLQQEWNNPESKQLILDFVLQNPDWRISVQIHKFLNFR
ncbi:MAG: 7-carboxy-7-deazaguanine synthase QueE [cyanobacterium endosymbiont of Rhopalodia musculus]|uniref:7-carboxy-7-deazaguanine synthase QueE n=1 Tax=cyanobacterium endosymbiont of Epithemia clementina EcSB TaxID=3034674 RepID=UPI002480C276|nr:7-carboxy-7-deazaguanine synthase QueE [cyanobacterium endosymbiont of Epithemia clementina EcSB]WGT66665.1 7-carboxy-7-deazaguanine synthase QueE [cyanobacterium endosymbiont of Epithemia clementina EcSB]